MAWKRNRKKEKSLDCTILVYLPIECCMQFRSLSLTGQSMKAPVTAARGMKGTYRLPYKDRLNTQELFCSEEKQLRAMLQISLLTLWRRPTAIHSSSLVRNREQQKKLPDVRFKTNERILCFHAYLYGCACLNWAVLSHSLTPKICRGHRKPLNSFIV